MALKLDMSKAYERVEWFLLPKIIQKIGFYPKWIQWAIWSVFPLLPSLLTLMERKKVMWDQQEDSVWGPAN